ncbi:MAG: PIN domain nuclease [Ruminiclostridium sp.]|nr:PIN domain nuclease [Ruminiclostridium sp.]
MVLVDTSVLIDFFKGTENKRVDKLNDAISNKIPFGICNLVYMELLQGARSEKEYRLLQKYLGTHRFYDVKHGLKSYEIAAMNYFICRKNGITVRSSIDMVIVQIALENNLYLLHNDSDYSNIAKVITELKEY